MTATLEPRQLSMFRTAIGNFPAAWRFPEPRPACLDVETTNPAETIILGVFASTETITLTLLRAHDRQFMAQAQFPLTSWQAAKDFLEGIALEAFVVGVDERNGTWSGSMILRSSDLDRRRDFSYVRSWLGTYDRG